MLFTELQVLLGSIEATYYKSVSKSEQERDNRTRTPMRHLTRISVTIFPEFFGSFFRLFLC